MNPNTPLTRKEIPAHVDPASVVDFDMCNDHRYRLPGGPHAALSRLAEECGRGMKWTPHNGGHWFINDYELLFAAVRDPGLFSSTAMTIPPLPPELEPRAIPLFSDPPEHGPYRMPLMKAFAPARIQAMERDIRAFAGELIDAVAGEARFDFFDKIAEPMPVIIFMKLMGMNLDRLQEFRGWMVDMVSDSDEARLGSHRNVAAMMKPLIEARMVERGNDLISWLLDADIDGRAITYDELQAYCLLLFAAGLDTVANSMGFGMNYLAGDVALQERLRAQPTLIPEAVEEFLRKYAVAMPGRTVTRDAEFGGVQIRAGERVMLMFPGGNTDPKIFSDAEGFDLDRENKLHLSFNSGPHRCVGSHLARLELRVLYEEWFKRMPNVRLDPERPTQYRTGVTLAVHSLPLIAEARA